MIQNIFLWMGKWHWTLTMSVIELYFAQHTLCTLVFHPHLRASPSFGWSRRILCSHTQFPSLGNMFHVSHEDIFLALKPILSPIHLDYPEPHYYPSPGSLLLPAWSLKPFSCQHPTNQPLLRVFSGSPALSRCFSRLQVSRMANCLHDTLSLSSFRYSSSCPLSRCLSSSQFLLQVLESPHPISDQNEQAPVSIQLFPWLIWCCNSFFPMLR